MAASPQWKVYDAAGKYQAACHEVEGAAALVSFYGDGSTIRADHARKFIMWTEGAENQRAYDSYDHVAATVYSRLDALRAAIHARRDSR